MVSAFHFFSLGSSPVALVNQVYYSPTNNTLSAFFSAGSNNSSNIHRNIHNNTPQPGLELSQLSTRD